MTQHKLYTEEQVKQMIDDAHNGVDGYYDIFKKHTPIKLPSDEEAGVTALKIAETLKDKLTAEQEAFFVAGFQTYPQWMRDKIK